MEALRCATAERRLPDVRRGQEGLAGGRANSPISRCSAPIRSRSRRRRSSDIDVIDDHGRRQDRARDAGLERLSLFGLAALTASVVPSGLSGRALGLGPAQVLVEPRHQLDEVAGPVAVIELVHQDFVPGVAAGAGRARQAEDEGRVRDARGGARLDGGRTDLGRLTMWNMVEKPSMRFSNSGSSASGVTSRPVKPVPPVVMTTSIAGSAIQALACARIFSTSSVTIARAATACPACCDPLRQRRARFVLGDAAGIRNRQHRDLERNELTALVETGHGAPFILITWIVTFPSHLGSLASFIRSA